MSTRAFSPISLSNSRSHSTHISPLRHTLGFDDVLTHIQRQMSRQALGSLTEKYSFRDGRDTLLHVLARRPEYRKISRELLRQMKFSGFNIDIKDDHGYTALHLAIMHRCDDKVSQLLEFEASMSCLDPQGLTPIHMAIQIDNKAAWMALLAAGASLDDASRAYLQPAVEQMLNDSIDRMDGPELLGSRLACPFGSCTTASRYYYNHTGGEDLAKLIVDVTTDEQLEALTLDIHQPCRWRSQSANYSTARHDILSRILQRRVSMTDVDFRNMAHQILECPPAEDKISLLELVCKYHNKYGSIQTITPALIGADPEILRSLVAMQPPQCYDAAAILFADPHRFKDWFLESIVSRPAIGMLDGPSDSTILLISQGLSKQVGWQTLEPQDFRFTLPNNNAAHAAHATRHDADSDLTAYWISHHWHEYSQPAALERLNYHLQSGARRSTVAACVAMTDKEKHVAYRVMQCIVHVVSKQAIEYAETELIKDLAACKKLTVDALRARQRFGLPDYLLKSQHLLHLWQAKAAPCIPAEDLFGKL